MQYPYNCQENVLCTNKEAKIGEEEYKIKLRTFCGWEVQTENYNNKMCLQRNDLAYAYTCTYYILYQFSLRP